MRRIASLAALALSAGGCAFGHPPIGPHGALDLTGVEAPTLAVPAPARLRTRRVVVLGRFDSTAVQPIGGLYDEVDPGVSPLYRTYSFPDGALEIFEATSDALRASGLEVLKDYATHAEPALVEAPLRAKDPLLVTATLVALQHDQVRREADPRPRDEEVARVAAHVEVRDLSGAVRFAKDEVVVGRTPARPGADLLRLLGLALGDRLARDPAFQKAVEAEVAP